MMKSYRTVRSRVVGQDDDDDQEDGGVAHQCPKCVLLKETADRRHNTVNIINFANSLHRVREHSFAWID